MTAPVFRRRPARLLQKLTEAVRGGSRKTSGGVGDARSSWQAPSGSAAPPTAAATVLPSADLYGTEGAEGRSQYFNTAEEFPNYLDPSFWPGPDGAPLSRQEIRGAWEKAVGSVARRLSIPLYEQGEVKQIRYFDRLQEQVALQYPAAHLLIPAGVLRSIRGHILYDCVQRGMEQHPPVSPQETLRRLEMDTSVISVLDVRGNGSDLDVQVELPGGTPQEEGRLLGEVKEFTDGLLKQFGHSSGNPTMMKSLFPKVDVNTYSDQTLRAVSQGGSSLDWQTFDLQTGELRDPPGVSGTEEAFLAGHYRFVNPYLSKAADPADNTIRGIRTLLESPHLTFKDRKAEGPFRDALLQLKRDVEKGKLPSPAAMEQFPRMVRNARRCGAHNRLYRGEPDSVEALVLEVIRTIEKRTATVNLVPEFIDHYPIAARTGDGAELHGLPKTLLCPVETFRRKYTDDGVLFHGTASVEAGLSILRGGLVLSRDGQGTAAFGRGAYTTHQKGTARGFARTTGLVLPLKIRTVPPPNILIWDEVKDSPDKTSREFFAKVRKDLGPLATLDDLFEALARKHGIDVIVHGHVLIQNADAIHPPKDPRELVQAFSETLSQPNPTFAEALRTVPPYLGIRSYGEALGMKDLPLAEPLVERLAVACRETLHSPPKRWSRKFDDWAESFRTYVNYHRTAVPKAELSVLPAPQEFSAELTAWAASPGRLQLEGLSLVKTLGIRMDPSAVEGLNQLLEKTLTTRSPKRIARLSHVIVALCTDGTEWKANGIDSEVVIQMVKNNLPHLRRVLRKDRQVLELLEYALTRPSDYL